MVDIPMACEDDLAGERRSDYSTQPLRIFGSRIDDIWMFCEFGMDGTRADAMIDTSVERHVIKVMVVDDHPLMRVGIASVIQGEPDMVVVAEAESGAGALESYQEFLPDVTLMDLQMPGLDGVEATVELRKRWPDARIVILTTHRGDIQILRALQAGASGYLLKSMIRSDLLSAIRCVHAGERRIPPEVAAELAAHVTDDVLSLRELEVLRCVGAGNSNRVVAATLQVSEETVKSHMKNIMNKLSARDRTHAVLIALKRGILNR